MTRLMLRLPKRWAPSWLVTHSTRLAEAVTASGAGKVRTVAKQDGATVIEGLKPIKFGRARRARLRRGIKSE